MREPEDDFEKDFEESYVEDLNSKHILNYIKENKKVIITVLAIISLIAITIVFLIVFGKKNTNENENVNTTLDTSTEENVSSNQNETSEEVTEPVDVEPVDDEQDPQNIVDNAASDSGAVQNISDINTTQIKSLGIDVSKYQGKIEWNKVKATGVEFAIIRVGYRTDKTGVIYEDAYAAYNLQKASEAGIKLGVYFFSTAVNETEAVEEAKWVANFIAKYAITYPVVYNCEGFTSLDSRMYGVSNSVRSANASAFLKYIEQQGYKGMLYAAKSELEGSTYWDTSALTSAYKIWVAQYPETPYPVTSKPSYSGTYAMWQYTNKGIVDGIDGYVDMNVANFNYDSVTQPKDNEPTSKNAENNPELGITFIAANEYVTAKDETNLRTAPNTQASVAATIKNGDIVLRVGIGDNGWSKLNYNGVIVYAKTNLLTTDTTKETTKETQTTSTNAGSKVTFTQVNEQVTAKEETNLRTVMSSADDSTIVVTIKNGEYVTRTGIGDNGWSRLEYNGQIVYAITSYLQIQD